MTNKIDIVGGAPSSTNLVQGRSLNVAALKWELQPYTKGTSIQISESPTKLHNFIIRVDSQPLAAGIYPDVTVKDLHDLSVFGSKQIDSIMLQREVDCVDIAEIVRLIKKGGYLCLIGQDVSIPRFKLVLDNKEMYLKIYQKE